MSLLILNIMIYLKNLTYYTWHLPDNYIVHVTIVDGKILLYGNNIVLFILFTDIMYPDYTVDVVTVAITELSQ